MPGIDGLEFLNKIKQLNNNIEVIVATGHGDLESSIKALRSGASDFIPKPMDIEMLLISVERALKKLEIKKRLSEHTYNLEALLKTKTKEIKQSQAIIMQSEKLASIGQLAAGVAHEINNPIGFISSNFETLISYTKDIKKVLRIYQGIFQKESGCADELITEIKAFEKKIDIEFILEDIEPIFDETNEGLARVKKIVADLKDFAHIDRGEKTYYNINKGLDSTLNIVNNELKYKAEVIKEYGIIQDIECYPRELNQVFMNLLVNAAQAIDEWGKIIIKTQMIEEKNRKFLQIIINDNGAGIPEKNLDKIFDPFFTTKQVGKGTGLGLNITHKVIKKHNGSITVNSKVGKGTTFIISLPAD